MGCKVKGCSKPLYAKGYCKNHHTLLRYRIQRGLSLDMSVRIKSGTKKRATHCSECGELRDPNISHALCTKCYKIHERKKGIEYRQNHPGKNQELCHNHFLKNREYRIEYQRAYGQAKREGMKWDVKEWKLKRRNVQIASTLGWLKRAIQRMQIRILSHARNASKSQDISSNN